MEKLKELKKELHALKEEQAKILNNYNALNLRNINVKIYNIRQQIKELKRQLELEELKKGV